MFVYVVRPEGLKYELCKNGTLIDDGSGLCMTYPENATLNTEDEFTTPLSFLDLASQTMSPLEGRLMLYRCTPCHIYNKIFHIPLNYIKTNL